MENLQWNRLIAYNFSFGLLSIELLRYICVEIQMYLNVQNPRQWDSATKKIMYKAHFKRFEQWSYTLYKTHISNVVMQD